MKLTVKQRAETMATFRYIAVDLMETLARWTPSTPEMEAKVLFGRHVWEAAQHADALGKRTYELRAPMHFTQKPSDEYLQYLSELNAVEGAAERMHAIYDIALPALAARYRSYLEQTDALLDAPSVKVIERILSDIEAMRRDADELRREMPSMATPSTDLSSLRATEARATNIVIHHVRPAMQEVSA
jgi:hypothetical protein